MKIGFFTLGCKVNQFETQAMQQMMLSRGHTLADFEDICDAYVINSCAVTATAEKKSRNAARRARARNPQSVIGLCGCSGQVSPERAQSLQVDVIGGTGDRAGFLDRLEAAAAGGGCRISIDEALKRRKFEILPAGSLSGRTRALLKVQDGCVNFCSYCIIPYARGAVRSLPLAEAISQTRKIADMGYRELVITGIEVAAWGTDFHDGSTLRDLVSAICRAAPDMRIRLSSLEPRTINAEFCRELSRFGNLCPQFHLSLQSGSDTVLQRMNRKYSCSCYLQSVRLLRQYFPSCAITTDLIVGFPGETEEEFSESLAFLDTCGFAGVHVFPYSRRAGTPAAKMQGQLTAAQKADRSARAVRQAERLRRAHWQAMLGTAQQVLFEEPGGAGYTGHAPDGTPVSAPWSRNLHNTLAEVKITDVGPDGLIGEITALIGADAPEAASHN